jgi:hypothetical protein
LVLFYGKTAYDRPHFSLTTCMVAFNHPAPQALRTQNTKTVENFHTLPVLLGGPRRPWLGRSQILGIPNKERDKDTQLQSSSTILLRVRERASESRTVHSSRKRRGSGEVA